MIIPQIVVYLQMNKKVGASLHIIQQSNERQIINH